MKSDVMTALALTALLLPACGSEATKPAAAPTAPVEAAVADPAPRTQAEGGATEVRIAEDIRKLCGISHSEAYFAFDSANLRREDRAVFEKLADCFTGGKLAGRRMLIIGRTDPRGDDEYNLVLGGRRAENVEGALVSLKMRRDQIRSSSRGEMDATGADEASWAADRRVDITLAN
jgi:outer membrane protein OmpA-like peptidoglycan-associated protein